MIVSDTHRLAFVHIPKCGGTSVRRQLEPVDSLKGAMLGNADHPTLGEINLAHIPLRFLKSDFPAEFAQVAAYRSFAIIREPQARFASAVFQRFQEFKGVERIEVTLQQALEEARQAVAWLDGRGAFCDASHIHFARQVDFVDLDGERVVSDVFRLDDMEPMAAAIRDYCGLELDPERRENTNFASSNPILSFLHNAKPIYSKLTTWEFRKQMITRLQRLKVIGPDSLYEQLLRDAEVNAFVERYYAEDLRLYSDLTTGKLVAPTVRRVGDAPLQRAAQ